MRTVSVSKANALIEMVKAFEKKDTYRVNQISKVFSDSIKKDNLDGVYNSNITLSQKNKQYFSKKVREYGDNIQAPSDSNIIIDTSDRIYTIRIVEGSIDLETSKKAKK